MENTPASASGPSAGTPPPGWYPDPHGQVRWWDGRGWTAQTQLTPGGPGPGPGPGMGVAGPGMAPMGPAGPNRTMAMVAHLGGIVGGWITPLVVYLIDGGKDRFVRHNAAEALNFQITVQIVSLVLFIPMFALFFGSIATTSTTRGPGAGFFSGFFLMIGVSLLISVLNIVWSIMGMVRANKLEYWRYPIRFKFVKGSLEPGELFGGQPS